MNSLDQRMHACSRLAENLEPALPDAIFLGLRGEARANAIDSLGRYKFAMLGYWAGIWVHLNHIIGDRQPSPFKHLVEAAKKGAVNANP